MKNNWSHHNFHDCYTGFSVSHVHKDCVSFWLFEENFFSNNVPAPIPVHFSPLSQFVYFMSITDCIESRGPNLAQKIEILHLNNWTITWIKGTNVMSPRSFVYLFCPSAAYMRRWTWSTLVQIMVCHLEGAKPLFELMLPYCQWDPRNIFRWHFIWNADIFIQENVFKHVVCEMAAILSGVRWVNDVISCNSKIYPLLQDDIHTVDEWSAIHVSSCMGLLPDT